MFQLSPLVVFQEILAAKGGTTWATNGRWILSENARRPRNTQGSFTCRKSTTWDRRLYFPSEGRRAEDFFALKNPTASVGFAPANLGTKGQHGHLVSMGKSRNLGLYKVLVKEPLVKDLLWKPRKRFEDFVKMRFGENRWGEVVENGSDHGHFWGFVLAGCKANIICTADRLLLSRTLLCMTNQCGSRVTCCAVRALM